MLSSGERAHVLRVRHDGSSWVLRLAAHTGAADALVAELAARRTLTGVALPQRWGHSPDGLWWTARPFVEGRAFDRALREAAPEVAAGWVIELLETLAGLHEAGLLHRDLKADNLLLGPDGPLILDLDLLGDHDARAAGSADHLAPELLLGRGASIATDLFALGATLAYAWCGAPSPRVRREFPQRPFWDAAELDAARVPALVRDLVRALVRRHPGDRPSTARDAAHRVDAARAAPPERALAFAAGREQPLAFLVDELRAAPRVRRELVLLELDDADESGELLGVVELHLALHARAARRLQLDAPFRVALAADCERAGEATLDGTRFAAAEGDDALLEVCEAFCGEPAAPGARWWVALAAPLAERAAGRLAALDPGVTLRRLPWPAPSAAALAAHLDGISDGASPAVAERLAASLHTLTEGRRAALREALERAPEQGVLRADAGRWLLLRDTWPASRELVDRARESWRALPDDAPRDALALLAAWGDALPLSRLAELSGAELGPLLDSLRALRREGCLRSELPLHEGVAWRAELCAPVLELAGREGARRAHARCLAVLPDDDVALERRALHVVGAAGEVDGLAPVFAQAERLVAGGRSAAARRVADAVRAHPLTSHDARLTDRLCEIDARIELAQARADRALELLEAGGLLGERGAPASWLLAAQAAEYAGRRELARELNTRVLAAADDASLRLHARVGLANAALLDGDNDALLALVAEPPEPNADPEAAARLLDLRAGALMRRGEWDASAEAYARAREHAARAASPLALARTELNRAQLDRRRARYADAVDALLRAEHAYARAGLVRERARALNNLGVVLVDRGECARAQTVLRQALSLRRRVGDEHGAALSLAALGVAALESSELAAARESLAAARAVFEERGYERELALVRLYAGLVDALCDGLVCDGPAPDASPTDAHDFADHPGLARWAAASLHALNDARPHAEQGARDALERSRAADDAAGTWRAAWLLLSAAPDAREAVDPALREAASALGGPVRAAELRWCLERPRDSRTLATLLDVFTEAGLHGRAWRCAEELRRACEREGDDRGRRRAAARVAQAADAVAGGLPEASRAEVLRRVSRLQPDPSPHEEDDPVQLQWLLSCNRRMAIEQDLEGLLLSIVDMALEVSAARRGLLVLLDGDEVDVQVARHMDHEDVSADELKFSRTVVREAAREKRAVVTTDAAADARFAGVASLASLETRAVLCVPLPGAEALQGALYLDDETRRVPFDDTDVQRVAALADQAQLAILNLRRRAEIERLNARLSERVSFQEEELSRARTALRKRGRVAPVGGLVGETEAMQRLYALIERVGPTDLSVLVTGPSGAGKDLVSRALHERSARADGPLIIENVAAVPGTLLESELFGHVRGAFTGADRDRRGLLAEAHGGTFVLDEIGELPMDVQPKLLRALETGEVRPVGGRSAQKVDVRFVAATNRDLLERVREGAFREDLYYRLNAMELRVPSLAERLADVPLLAEHFLTRLNDEHGTSKRFHERVLRALVQRTWPGEVRELRNEVSRLYFLSDEVLDDAALVREPAARDAASSAAGGSLRLDEVERATILRALDAAGGRKDRAAQMLGISRAGLYTKLKRLDIDLDRPAG